MALTFDVEKLIIWIEERPNLWDTHSESYHDRVKKDQSWEEIGKELAGNIWEKADSKKRQSIIKKIKSRWHSCRDQFRRELNMKTKSGDGSLTKKPYIYTANLQFLRPIMELRPTVDNLDEEEGDSDVQPRSSQEAPIDPSSEGASENVEAEAADPSHEELTESAMEETPIISAPHDPAPRQQPSRRLRRSSGRRRGGHQHDSGLDARALIDARVIEYLSQNRVESKKEDRLLRSLGPFLERVPVERQERCMSALTNVLFAFSSQPDPQEVEHFLERYRDNIVSPPHSSHPTVGPPPQGHYYPPSAPMFPRGQAYEPRRHPLASSSASFNPGSFTRDLFDL